MAFKFRIDQVSNGINLIVSEKQGRKVQYATQVGASWEKGTEMDQRKLAMCFRSIANQLMKEHRKLLKNG